MVKAKKEVLEEHYSDLKKKSFFSDLIEYMGSGPIIAMVWEGWFLVFIFLERKLKPTDKLAPCFSSKSQFFETTIMMISR